MPNAPVQALDATPLELRTLRNNGIEVRPDTLERLRAGMRAAGLLSKTESTQQKPASRPYAPYRSKWEQQYAEHLELRRMAGQIRAWDYEPWRILIGVDAWYTPDFRLLMPDGSIHWHEVKGYRREAAIVRIKAAALAHPNETFVLVTKKGGQWDFTTIGAR